MTSTHANCSHSSTSSARAKCRRRKAQDAADLAKFEAEEKAYYEAYILPYERQEAARKEWEALRNADTSHPGQVLSAEINADDTAIEEGFEAPSLRWYQVAYSTLAMLLDTGENNYPDTQFK
jgi:hypothetical protein